jgi:hypothetical protein
LIQAALDKWEQRRTEAVIEDFERARPASG